MKPIQFSKLMIVPALFCASTAFANMSNMVNNMSQSLSMYTLDCAHWYAGANLGISHLYDDANPGSGNSVDQNGPGGSAQLGYQWNSILGTELGYTQYSNSKEKAAGAVIAQTSHYAVDLTMTGRTPLVYRWSVLGKLGAAYSYAQKIATATGTSADSGAVSLYWGLGIDYSVTQKIDLIAQFAEAVGNSQTGSSDLWSLGVNLALV